MEASKEHETILKRRKASEIHNALVDDLRIDFLSPLLPPSCLIEELPLTQSLASHVTLCRKEVHACVAREDDRLIVIVGPCSIHDTDACLEYAQRLMEARRRFSNELLIIMRVYFEKPRTTVGWKGLINDPELDGTFKINKGLRLSREFLLKVNQLGMPVAVEFLDVISPQFLGDLVSWGAIGARTTESQVHRELASGLSCPVGFKNSTSGDVQVAIDACGCSQNPHSFLSVSKQGLAAIVHTKGNLGCHIILRGGNGGTNYDEDSVKAAAQKMEKLNLQPRIVIDCSHGNSRKNHKNQPLVAASVAKQVAAGNRDIVGVLIESHLHEGNQKLTPGVTDVKLLKRGVSVTDACLHFEDTIGVLEGLAQAVKERRQQRTL